MEGINNVKMIISRWYDARHTQGSIFIMEGDFILYKGKCLELAWLDNKQNVSCIQEGIYNAKKEMHKTRGKVFRLLWVRGRSGILMHIGNFVAGKKIDSEGCILPGRYLDDINNDGFIDVVESTIAMNEMWAILPEEFKIHIL